ncbi:MAG: DUF2095 family protein [Candidatus Hodarchaeales archaeon]
MAKDPSSGKEEKKGEDLKVDLYQPISINQKIPIDQIRKHFPALYKEIAENHMSLKVKTESTNEDEAKKEKFEDPFNNYMPDIFDFLRRAKSEEEGIEILDFFEKQNQISSEEATRLREKLKTDGIRVFGSYKSPNYYFRKAEEINTRKAIKKRYSLYLGTHDSATSD